MVRTLPVLLGFAAAAFGTCSLFLLWRWPLPVVFVLVALAATAMAGVPGGMRSLLTDAVGTGARLPALSVNATLTEALAVAGRHGRGELSAAVFIAVIAVASAMTGVAYGVWGLRLRVSTLRQAVGLLAVEDVAPTAQRARAFSLAYAANGAGFTVGGLGILVLPTGRASILAVAAVVVVLVLAPLARHRGP